MDAATAPKYAALGARLRRARERRGISQENFAPMVGTTRRHLIRLEGGHHLPSLELRAKIAEATQVDAREFMSPEDADEEAALSADLAQTLMLLVRREISRAVA